MKAIEKSKQSLDLYINVVTSNNLYHFKFGLVSM